jgi:hypothetical protein
VWKTVHSEGEGYSDCAGLRYHHLFLSTSAPCIWKRSASVAGHEIQARPFRRPAVGLLEVTFWLVTAAIRRLVDLIYLLLVSINKSIKFPPSAHICPFAFHKMKLPELQDKKKSKHPSLARSLESVFAVSNPRSTES